MTRKYDTLILSRVMVKGGATRWPSADYSSRQNSGSGKAVSLRPSQLAQGDVAMENKHSLLAIYASAERRRPATMIGTEG